MGTARGTSASLARGAPATRAICVGARPGPRCRQRPRSQRQPLAPARPPTSSSAGSSATRQ
eukprot:5591207-Lingulodinium_polyedra.AAC.1